MGAGLSSVASYILPSVMSATGTIVPGVGTIHGWVTPWVARVAAKGTMYTGSVLYAMAVALV